MLVVCLCGVCFVYVEGVCCVGVEGECLSCVCGEVGWLCMYREGDVCVERCVCVGGVVDCGWVGVYGGDVCGSGMWLSGVCLYGRSVFCVGFVCGVEGVCV